MKYAVALLADSAPSWFLADAIRALKVLDLTDILVLGGRSKSHPNVKYLPNQEIAGSGDLLVRAHAPTADAVIVVDLHWIESTHVNLQSAVERRLKGPVVDDPGVRTLNFLPKAAVTHWTPSQGRPPITGCTIITPGYEEVGTEAVRRWEAYSGMPCLALHAAGGREAFEIKLSLPLFLNAQRIAFFDADWWALRPLPIKELTQKPFSAVVDPGASRDPRSFAAKDCEDHRMNPSLYFNSGFWVADLTKQAVMKVFAEALTFFKNEGWHDFGEQSALNKAVQSERPWKTWVAPHRLPLEWNFFLHAVKHSKQSFIPSKIYGLHAAGVPAAQKMEHLTLYAKAFGYPMSP